MDLKVRNAMERILTFSFGVKHLNVIIIRKCTRTRRICFPHIIFVFLNKARNGRVHANKKAQKKKS